MVPGDSPRDPPPTQAALPDLWGAHLAGQALVEVADIVNIPDRHKPKLARVKQWLIHLIEHAKNLENGDQGSGAGDRNKLIWVGGK